MPIPRAASSHYRDVARLIAMLDRSIRRTWRAMRPDANWQQQWAVVAPTLTATVAASQREAASLAPDYLSALLAEIGLAEATHAGSGALSHLNPSSLAGVASDGRDLASLLYGAVVHAGERYNAGLSAPAALVQGRRWLTETVETQIMDTARVASEVQTLAQAPDIITGYVRMVEPGACSRCIILAGKFYRWNSGFLRHPGCRCVHIPAAEYVAEHWSTDPSVYFENLSHAEQDRIFTKAGAEAIRLGADPSQVVNARRGMTWTGQTQTTIRNGRVVNLHRRSAATTDLYGHDALITTAGTTKRGVFGHLERKRGGEFAVAARRRQGAVKNYAVRRAKRARLMPETILAEARDRDDAVRLLRLYGYLGPVG